MAEQAAELARWLAEAGLRTEINASLAAYTTFRLGGPCPLLVHCTTAMDVQRAVEALKLARRGFVLIGGGSNLLVADEGIDDVVLRFVAPQPSIRHDGKRLVVSGGTSLDDLARISVVEGLGGLVSASGIPGTVGGAIVGNAGAYGWSISDELEAVEVLGRDGERRTRTPQEIGFAYRDSGLKSSGEIVLEATFRPPPTDPEALGVRRREILDLRRRKHPDITVDACAGSFFRNVAPTSAAARREAAGGFLEQAGAKTMREGGAAVFARHANILVKASNDCRAADVYRLSRRMAAAVKARFGLELVREVQLLGHFAEGGE